MKGLPRFESRHRELVIPRKQQTLLVNSTTLYIFFNRCNPSEELQNSTDYFSVSPVEKWWGKERREALAVARRHIGLNVPKPMATKEDLRLQPRRAFNSSGVDDLMHVPRYAPWGHYLDGMPVRNHAPMSAFWGPRGVGDVSWGSSSALSPSTYHYREQRRWLRDLGGTLARAAADVNLADNISARTYPAATAEYRRAIDDLAVQALRVLTCIVVGGDCFVARIYLPGAIESWHDSLWGQSRFPVLLERL